MIKSAKPVLAVAPVVTMVLGVVGVASSSADVIKERQQTMDSTRDGLMTLAAIAKKEAPFDASVVHKSTVSIEDRLREAGRLFPEGSGQGDAETWAKPEIWSDYADFVVKLEEAQAQANALKSVTEESAFAPATAVIQRGPEFKTLATNTLEDGFDASPVAVDSELYLRGQRFLYRISE